MTSNAPQLLAEQTDVDAKTRERSVVEECFQTMNARRESAVGALRVSQHIVAKTPKS
jgi:hypothetical protein